MKKSKLCDMANNCGGRAVEFIGLILIFIASLLTIISLDSFGIVAMFAVGVVMLAHKHCHRSNGGVEGCETEKATPAKPKAPAKKNAPKK